MQADTHFPFAQYVYVVGGILISVCVPLLRKAFPSTLVTGLAIPVAPPMKAYFAIGAFSLLTAVLIVAYGGSSTASWAWYTAVLAGYAWDSTLQKIVRG
jgi:hypothetical protein